MGKLYEAIKLLDDCRRDYKPIKEILLDNLFVAHGYIFVVESRGERYMLINTADFQRLTAGLDKEHSDLLTKSWMGIPVYEDRQKVQNVIVGIYENVIAARDIWRPY